MLCGQHLEAGWGVAGGGACFPGRGAPEFLYQRSHLPEETAVVTVVRSKRVSKLYGVDQGFTTVAFWVRQFFVGGPAGYLEASPPCTL